MKSLILLFPLACSALNCSIELDVTSPCILECTGKHSLSYDDDPYQFENRFAKRDAVLESPKGMIWGNDPKAHFSMLVTPLKNSRILLNGTEYPGALEFRLNKKVINYVDVNLVVQSILESPEFLGYSLETLKALAIALRTDLVAETKLFTAEELNYEGSAMLYQYPKIAQAVVETRNEIITYHNHPFPTSYCKDAGGKNASFADIFRQSNDVPEGNMLPVSQTKTWKKQFSKQEFCERLKITGLVNLAFYKDQKSSKIYAVKIEDKAGKRVLKIDRFMNLLELDSNEFQFENQKNYFIFEGKGEGLGVGLCLKTAEKMAHEGRNYEEILQICYPGIQLSLCEK